jgi:hypothetical protein
MATGPTPNRLVTRRPDVYELLLDDADHYGYPELATLIGAHREAHRPRSAGNQPAHEWRDAIADAAAHLAAALVALRRATAENVPGTRPIYLALLTAAGALARRHPRHVAEATWPLAIPTQRTRR